MKKSQPTHVKVERAVLALLFSELAKVGWHPCLVAADDDSANSKHVGYITRFVFARDITWITFQSTRHQPGMHVGDVKIVRGHGREAGEVLGDWNYSIFDATIYGRKSFNSTMKRIARLIESSSLKFEVKS